jgi:spore coat polysaccharide biosynthesis predicted glycosyltransferase SpsG
MNKILFRCDSSKNQGTGHVTRSYALAEIFAINGWEVTFSGEFKDPDWILGLLTKIKEIKIQRPSKTIQENESYEVIVFDSYIFDPLEVEIFSKLGKMKVSIVDDISSRIEADIFISSLPARYLPQFNDVSKCLFGPEYALVRKDIVFNKKEDESRSILKENYTIGLFSGGSSKKEFLEIILNQIIPIVKGCNIRIFSDYMELKEIYKNMINLELVSPRPEFYNDLQDIDLVISPASVSSWEFLSIGIPIAVYGIYANQKSTYDFIVDSGYAEGLGYVKNYKTFQLNESNFNLALKRISHNELGRAITQKIFDREGPIRIYNEIMNFYNMKLK